MSDEVDIRENNIFKLYPGILEMLLKDHTTQKNIFWATDSYASLGKDYQYNDPIAIASITGKNGMLLRPRAVKSTEEQTQRSKDMAEVFTPSWVCNAQNNLVDEAWFQRKDVFNKEIINEQEQHLWKTIYKPVSFPEHKSWKDYVQEKRMEVTCGEAPYLVSRYDTVSGTPILLKDRIGLLDRKLRVINENVDQSGKWLEMAQKAYKSTFGFEWQGDNLLLAREALFLTFVENYQAKFGKQPLLKSMQYIAYIISWNIWQMDGLKGVIPDSCKNNVIEKESTLFGEEDHLIKCPGCQQDDIRKHNGTYCLLRDWGRKDPKTGENNKKIRFIDLLK